MLQPAASSPYPGKGWILERLFTPLVRQKDDRTDSSKAMRVRSASLTQKEACNELEIHRGDAPKR
jgi:hypothetical protein